MSIAVIEAEQLRQIVAEAVEPLRRELEQMRRAQAGGVVSIAEAARRLGVSRRTIERHLEDGTLIPVMVGDRRRVRLDG